MTCKCFIIPLDVLKKFASDPELTEEVRNGFSHTHSISKHIRAIRTEHSALAQTLAELYPVPAQISSKVAVVHTLPPSTVYDCKQGTSQPGVPVPNPGTSADGTVKRAYNEAEAVAKFYWDLFGRDSIDAHHMTLVSSVHYSKKFNNAFWDGTHMTYGDGDGQVFIDFTLGNDVIGHELTHGVTQYSAAFSYSNEAGGLNESMSDVFGSMFRQWQANQDVNAADWLIGYDIMGPVAKSRGYTCLRDMSNPAAAHCLAPQPTHFNQYHAGMDPHYSSGIPNFAFYKAAKAVGGHSWDKVGKIWYKALTGYAPAPNMLMSKFANRTRTLSKSMFPNDASVQNAVNNAWTAVGL
jgi:Zn-dependent metalloprotease